jgi:hypothetical protein
LYKSGFLIAGDGAPPGNHNDLTNVGPTDDMSLLFNNDSTMFKGGEASGVPANAPITNWAAAKAGSWGTQYGDDSSNYMLVCSDLSGVYTISLTYAKRCIAHLKKPGTEEIIIQWDSVKPASSTPVATHWHYPQDGETTISAYPEGLTTCPGAGGCGSLDTNRTIQSMEDGGGVSPTDNNPARIYGVISKFLSPGTIHVVYDGQASPQNGFQGHTERVSICGGTSCAASVATFEALSVHKVAQNLTDTTLLTTALNPDANWTGVQTADKVALFSRGGVNRATIPGFITTHSGSAQYLFGGVAAGSYAVTLNGTPVPGSPFTVADGDNSIEFEGISGTVSVNGGVAAPPGQGSGLFGNVGARGSVVIH